jgi:hypothetical protein
MQWTRRHVQSCHAWKETTRPVQQDAWKCHPDCHQYSLLALRGRQKGKHFTIHHQSPFIIIFIELGPIVTITSATPLLLKTMQAPKKAVSKIKPRQSHVIPRYFGVNNWRKQNWLFSKHQILLEPPTDLLSAINSSSWAWKSPWVCGGKSTRTMLRNGQSQPLKHIETL